jgi:hypothetical protein
MNQQAQTILTTFDTLPERIRDDVAIEIRGKSIFSSDHTHKTGSVTQVFTTSRYSFQEKEFFAKVRPRPRGQATDKQLPARARAHREKHFFERYSNDPGTHNYRGVNFPYQDCAR